MRYEIRRKPLRKNERVYGFLYCVFDNLKPDRVSGWVNNLHDARTILRCWEERTGGAKMIDRDSLKNDIERKINEMADGVFETVCDELCRWPHECGDETSLWEAHCNECPLKKYL